MTFLPLAERELRVAARQPITRRLRVGAALAAGIVAAGIYLVMHVGSVGIPPSAFGKVLFYALISIALCAALMAGAFLTSDCLSEEKREGTLGFLFLTDLRGHDVVLGKLASTSVRAGFALLALFPILGVTLLFGGVTGLQFFKSALALLSTLAVSLSAGMLSSALSRQPQKSLALTLLFLAVPTLGGPLMDGWLSGRGGAVFFRILSPAYLMICAQGGVPGSFWAGWSIQLALAALLLWVSSRILPHVWQDRAKPAAPGSSVTRSASETSVPVIADRRRARLLDENPALWLAVRDRWMLWVAWGLASGLMIATVGFGVACWSDVASSGSAASGTTPWGFVLTMVWNMVSSLVMWVLVLSVATHAVRFFVDARRSGLLELLLATPLSHRDIVSGHWRGWCRAYRLPVLLCLAMAAVSSWAVQSVQFRQISAVIPMATAAPGITNAPGLTSTNSTTVNLQLGTGVQMSGTVSGTSVPPLSEPFVRWVPVTTALLTSGSTVLNLIALAWVGMWMGLTSRGVTVAALKTVVFVLVIPWFVIAVLAAIAMPLIFFPMLKNSATAGPGPSFQTLMIWSPLLSV
ncbi:MAG: hypothetical protein KIT22_10830, partial [Verrucomicrobiae bacterium]|nr:hypothetical protein [Verrucomicrobiae bacterium]